MTFRNFCMEIWFQHIEEIEAYTGKPPCYSAREYFHKYKWFLRKIYEEQKAGNSNTTSTEQQQKNLVVGK